MIGLLGHTDVAEISGEVPPSRGVMGQAPCQCGKKQTLSDPHFLENKVEFPLHVRSDPLSCPS